MAHTYLAFAFRKLGPDGAPARPPPPLENTGYRRLTDADILWLAGGDGVAAPSGGAAAGPGAAASRKRERPGDETGGGRPAKAAHAEADGRAPQQFLSEEKDALFD